MSISSPSVSSFYCIPKNTPLDNRPTRSAVSLKHPGYLKPPLCSFPVDNIPYTLHVRTLIIVILIFIPVLVQHYHRVNKGLIIKTQKHLFRVAFSDSPEDNTHAPTYLHQRLVRCPLRQDLRF